MDLLATACHHFVASRIVMAVLVHGNRVPASWIRLRVLLDHRGRLTHLHHLWEGRVSHALTHSLRLQSRLPVVVLRVAVLVLVHQWLTSRLSTRWIKAALVVLATLRLLRPLLLHRRALLANGPRLFTVDPLASILAIIVFGLVVRNHLLFIYKSETSEIKI